MRQPQRERSLYWRKTREICFGADRRKRSAVNRLGIAKIAVLPTSRCDLSPHRAAACAPVPPPPQAGKGRGGGWRSSLSRPSHPERPGLFRFDNTALFGGQVRVADKPHRQCAGTVGGRKK